MAQRDKRETASTSSRSSAPKPRKRSTKKTSARRPGTRRALPLTSLLQQWMQPLGPGVVWVITKGLKNSPFEPGGDDEDLGDIEDVTRAPDNTEAEALSSLLERGEGPAASHELGDLFKEFLGPTTPAPQPTPPETPQPAPPAGFAGLPSPQPQAQEPPEAAPVQTPPLEAEVQAQPPDQTVQNRPARKKKAQPKPVAADLSSALEPSLLEEFLAPEEEGAPKKEEPRTQQAPTQEAQEEPAPASAETPPQETKLLRDTSIPKFSDEAQTQKFEKLLVTQTRLYEATAHPSEYSMIAGTFSPLISASTSKVGGEGSQSQLRYYFDRLFDKETPCNLNGLSGWGAMLLYLLRRYPNNLDVTRDTPIKVVREKAKERLNGLVNSYLNEISENKRANTLLGQYSSALKPFVLSMEALFVWAKQNAQRPPHQIPTEQIENAFQLGRKLQGLMAHIRYLQNEAGQYLASNYLENQAGSEAENEFRQHYEVFKRNIKELFGDVSGTEEMAKEALGSYIGSHLFFASAGGIARTLGKQLLPHIEALGIDPKSLNPEIAEAPAGDIVSRFVNHLEAVMYSLEPFLKEPLPLPAKTNGQAVDQGYTYGATASAAGTAPVEPLPAEEEEAAPLPAQEVAEEVPPEAAPEKAQAEASPPLDTVLPTRLDDTVSMAKLWAQTPSSGLSRQAQTIYSNLYPKTTLSTLQNRIRSLQRLMKRQEKEEGQEVALQGLPSYLYQASNVGAVYLTSLARHAAPYLNQEKPLEGREELFLKNLFRNLFGAEKATETQAMLDEVLKTAAEYVPNLIRLLEEPLQRYGKKKPGEEGETANWNQVGNRLLKDVQKQLGFLQILEFTFRNLPRLAQLPDETNILGPPQLAPIAKEFDIFERAQSYADSDVARTFGLYFANRPDLQRIQEIISDDTLPIPQRQAALESLRQICQEYQGLVEEYLADQASVSRNRLDFGEVLRNARSISEKVEQWNEAATSPGGDFETKNRLLNRLLFLHPLQPINNLFTAYSAVVLDNSLFYERGTRAAGEYRMFPRVLYERLRTNVDRLEDLNSYFQPVGRLYDNATRQLQLGLDAFVTSLREGTWRQNAQAAAPIAPMPIETVLPTAQETLQNLPPSPPEWEPTLQKATQVLPESAQRFLEGLRVAASPQDTAHAYNLVFNNPQDPQTFGYYDTLLRGLDEVQSEILPLQEKALAAWKEAQERYAQQTPPTWNLETVAQLNETLGSFLPPLRDIVDTLERARKDVQDRFGQGEANHLDRYLENLQSHYVGLYERFSQTQSPNQLLQLLRDQDAIGEVQALFQQGQQQQQWLQQTLQTVFDPVKRAGIESVAKANEAFVSPALGTREGLYGFWSQSLTSAQNLRNAVAQQYREIPPFEAVVPSKEGAGSRLIQEERPSQDLYKETYEVVSAYLHDLEHIDSTAQAVRTAENLQQSVQRLFGRAAGVQNFLRDLLRRAEKMNPDQRREFLKKRQQEVLNSRAHGPYYDGVRDFVGSTFYQQLMTPKTDPERREKDWESLRQEARYLEDLRLRYLLRMKLQASVYAGYYESVPGARFLQSATREGRLTDVQEKEYVQLLTQTEEEGQGPQLSVKDRAQQVASGLFASLLRRISPVSRSAPETLRQDYQILEGLLPEEERAKLHIKRRYEEGKKQGQFGDLLGIEAKTPLDQALERVVQKENEITRLLTAQTQRLQTIKELQDKIQAQEDPKVQRQLRETLDARLREYQQATEEISTGLAAYEDGSEISEHIAQMYRGAAKVLLSVREYGDEEAPIQKVEAYELRGKQGQRLQRVNPYVAMKEFTQGLATAQEQTQALLEQIEAKLQQTPFHGLAGVFATRNERNRRRYLLRQRRAVESVFQTIQETFQEVLKSQPIVVQAEGENYALGLEYLGRLSHVPYARELVWMPQDYPSPMREETLRQLEAENPRQRVQALKEFYLEFLQKVVPEQFDPQPIQESGSVTELSYAFLDALRQANLSYATVRGAYVSGPDNPPFEHSILVPEGYGNKTEWQRLFDEGGMRAVNNKLRETYTRALKTYGADEEAIEKFLKEAQNLPSPRELSDLFASYAHDLGYETQEQPPLREFTLFTLSPAQAANARVAVAQETAERLRRLQEQLFPEGLAPVDPDNYNAKNPVLRTLTGIYKHSLALVQRLPQGVQLHDRLRRLWEEQPYEYPQRLRLEIRKYLLDLKEAHPEAEPFLQQLENFVEDPSYTKIAAAIEEVGNAFHKAQDYLQKPEAESAMDLFRTYSAIRQRVHVLFEEVARKTTENWFKNQKRRPVAFQNVPLLPPGSELEPSLKRLDLTLPANHSDYKEALQEAQQQFLTPDEVSPEETSLGQLIDRLSRIPSAESALSRVVNERNPFSSGGMLFKFLDAFKGLKNRDGDDIGQLPKELYALFTSFFPAAEARAGLLNQFGFDTEKKDEQTVFFSGLLQDSRFRRHLFNQLKEKARESGTEEATQHVQRFQRGVQFLLHFLEPAREYEISFDEDPSAQVLAGVERLVQEGLVPPEAKTVYEQNLKKKAHDVQMAVCRYALAALDDDYRKKLTHAIKNDMDPDEIIPPKQLLSTLAAVAHNYEVLRENIENRVIEDYRQALEPIKEAIPPEVFDKILSESIHQFGADEGPEVIYRRVHDLYQAVKAQRLSEQFNRAVGFDFGELPGVATLYGSRPDKARLLQRIEETGALTPQLLKDYYLQLFTEKLHALAPTGEETPEQKAKKEELIAENRQLLAQHLENLPALKVRPGQALPATGAVAPDAVEKANQAFRVFYRATQGLLLDYGYRPGLKELQRVTLTEPPGMHVEIGEPDFRKVLSMQLSQDYFTPAMVRYLTEQARRPGHYKRPEILDRVLGPNAPFNPIMMTNSQWHRLRNVLLHEFRTLPEEQKQQVRQLEEQMRQQAQEKSKQLRSLLQDATVPVQEKRVAFEQYLRLHNFRTATPQENKELEEYRRLFAEGAFDEKLAEAARRAQSAERKTSPGFSLYQEKAKRFFESAYASGVTGALYRGIARQLATSRLPRLLGASLARIVGVGGRRQRPDTLEQALENLQRQIETEREELLRSAPQEEDTGGKTKVSLSAAGYETARSTLSLLQAQVATVRSLLEDAKKEEDESLRDRKVQAVENALQTMLSTYQQTAQQLGYSNQILQRFHHVLNNDVFTSKTARQEKEPETVEQDIVNTLFRTASEPLERLTTDIWGRTQVDPGVRNHLARVVEEINRTSALLARKEGINVAYTPEYFLRGGKIEGEDAYGMAMLAQQERALARLVPRLAVTNALPSLYQNFYRRLDLKQFFPGEGPTSLLQSLRQEPVVYAQTQARRVGYGALDLTKPLLNIAVEETAKRASAAINSEAAASGRSYTDQSEVHYPVVFRAVPEIQKAYSEWQQLLGKDYPNLTNMAKTYWEKLLSTPDPKTRQRLIESQEYYGKTATSILAKLKLLRQTFEEDYLPRAGLHIERGEDGLPVLIPHDTEQFNSFKQHLWEQLNRDPNYRGAKDEEELFERYERHVEDLSTLLRQEESTLTRLANAFDAKETGPSGYSLAELLDLYYNAVKNRKESQKGYFDQLVEDMVSRGLGFVLPEEIKAQYEIESEGGTLDASLPHRIRSLIETLVGSIRPQEKPFTRPDPVNEGFAKVFGITYDDYGTARRFLSFARNLNEVLLRWQKEGHSPQTAVELRSALEKRVKHLHSLLEALESHSFGYRTPEESEKDGKTEKVFKSPAPITESEYERLFGQGFVFGSQAGGQKMRGKKRPKEEPKRALVSSFFYTLSSQGESRAEMKQLFEDIRGKILAVLPEIQNKAQLQPQTLQQLKDLMSLLMVSSFRFLRPDLFTTIPKNQFEGALSNEALAFYLAQPEAASRLLYNGEENRPVVDLSPQEQADLLQQRIQEQLQKIIGGAPIGAQIQTVRRANKEVPIEIRVEADPNAFLSGPDTPYATASLDMLRHGVLLEVIPSVKNNENALIPDKARPEEKPVELTSQREPGQRIAVRTPITQRQGFRRGKKEEEEPTDVAFDLQTASTRKRAHNFLVMTTPEVVSSLRVNLQEREGDPKPLLDQKGELDKTRFLGRSLGAWSFMQSLYETHRVSPYEQPFYPLVRYEDGRELSNSYVIDDVISAEDLHRFRMKKKGGYGLARIDGIVVAYRTPEDIRPDHRTFYDVLREDYQFSLPKRRVEILQSAQEEQPIYQRLVDTFHKLGNPYGITLPRFLMYYLPQLETQGLQLALPETDRYREFMDEVLRRPALPHLAWGPNGPIVRELLPPKEGSHDYSLARIQLTNKAGTQNDFLVLLNPEDIRFRTFPEEMKVTLLSRSLHDVEDGTDNKIRTIFNQHQFEKALKENRNLTLPEFVEALLNNPEIRQAYEAERAAGQESFPASLYPIINGDLEVVDLGTEKNNRDLYALQLEIPAPPDWEGAPERIPVPVLTTRYGYAALQEKLGEGDQEQSRLSGWELSPTGVKHPLSAGTESGATAEAVLRQVHEGLVPTEIPMSLSELYSNVFPKDAPEWVQTFSRFPFPEGKLPPQREAAYRKIYDQLMNKPLAELRETPVMDANMKPKPASSLFLEWYAQNKGLLGEIQKTLPVLVADRVVENVSKWIDDLNPRTLDKTRLQGLFGFRQNLLGLKSTLSREIARLKKEGSDPITLQEYRQAIFTVNKVLTGFENTLYTALCGELFYKMPLSVLLAGGVDDAGHYANPRGLTYADFLKELQNQRIESALTEPIIPSGKDEKGQVIKRPFRAMYQNAQHNLYTALLPPTSEEDRNNKATLVYRTLQDVFYVLSFLQSKVKGTQSIFHKHEEYLRSVFTDLSAAYRGGEAGLMEALLPRYESLALEATKMMEDAYEAVIRQARLDNGVLPVYRLQVPEQRATLSESAAVGQSPYEIEGVISVSTLAKTRQKTGLTEFVWPVGNDGLTKEQHTLVTRYIGLCDRIYRTLRENPKHWLERWAGEDAKRNAALQLLVNRHSYFDAGNVKAIRLLLNDMDLQGKSRGQNVPLTDAYFNKLVEGLLTQKSGSRTLFEALMALDRGWGWTPAARTLFAVPGHSVPRTMSELAALRRFASSPSTVLPKVVHHLIRSGQQLHKSVLAPLNSPRWRQAVIRSAWSQLHKAFFELGLTKEGFFVNTKPSRQSSLLYG